MGFFLINNQRLCWFSSWIEFKLPWKLLERIYIYIYTEYNMEGLINFQHLKQRRPFINKGELITRV